MGLNAPLEACLPSYHHSEKETVLVSLPGILLLKTVSHCLRFVSSCFAFSSRPSFSSRRLPRSHPCGGFCSQDAGESGPRGSGGGTCSRRARPRAPALGREAWAAAPVGTVPSAQLSAWWPIQETRFISVPKPPRVRGFSFYGDRPQVPSSVMGPCIKATSGKCHSSRGVREMPSSSPFHSWRNGGQKAQVFS